MNTKTYLSTHFWKILFTVLLLITIGLLTWFIIDLQTLYHTGQLRPTRGMNRTYLQKNAAQPTQIEGWMTFSYVNYVFSLPPTYLSSTLGISESAYPELGIDRYAHTKNLDPVTFLTTIQHAVANYATSASATSTVQTSLSK